MAMSRFCLEYHPIGEERPQNVVLWIGMRLQPGMPFWMILNYNPVLSEIVKSAVGSIGMFISIPLTAFISVRLFKK